MVFYGENYFYFYLLLKRGSKMKFLGGIFSFLGLIFSWLLFRNNNQLEKNLNHERTSRQKEEKIRHEIKDQSNSELARRFNNPK